MLTRKPFSVNRFGDLQPAVAAADGCLYLLNRKLLNAHEQVRCQCRNCGFRHTALFAARSRWSAFRANLPNGLCLCWRHFVTGRRNSAAQPALGGRESTTDAFRSQLTAAREEFGWAKRPFESESKMGSSRHMSALEVEESWTWILKNSINHDGVRDCGRDFQNKG